MGEAEKKRSFELPIEEELRTSYLNYAMSVLVARALPDARDGLKPSQRRILIAARDLDLGPRSKHRKCAKIAGDTSGNYHPHGEQVVYPTLVRMAQDFNMRYPLVDGQGNFGSIDGDPPAAMRYTEARLSRAAVELLDDLNLDTVDMRPNYDETRTEPEVLPARFPNLLANGSSGIAVGMATSIPPHNLAELCEAVRLVLENPDCSPLDILEVMPGPDFPTGGIVLGKSGLLRGYATGQGKIIVRARTHFEERGADSYSIVVTEIPYAVTKTAIIQKIADCAKSGAVAGISDIRDESDRHGMRIVIMLKRGEDPEVVLNNLFRHTPLQTTFSLNFIALSGGRPVQMNVKDLINAYITHRRDVIRRRTRHLLEKARARLHIVEGLLIALDAIDEVIKTIRSSEGVSEARSALMERFGLSRKQADAILSMRLQQLTRLEVDKLQAEAEELRSRIADYRDILANPARVDGLIKDDLEHLKSAFSDERRTEIRMEEFETVDLEDLIREEYVSVTVSKAGYVKRQPLEAYRSQRRGGKGVLGAPTRDGDFVRDLFTASTHDHLLVFTSTGQVHSVRVFEIPEAGRYSRGRALSNFLGLSPEESVQTVLPVADFQGDYYVFFATRKGVVKRTALSAFANIRRGGIRAVNLREGDALVGAVLTTGEDELFLATRLGQACRFRESDVRPMGRIAAGVTGMRLRDGDEVVSLFRVEPGAQVLTVCRNGYGKRSPFEEYRITRRGALGVRNIRVNERNGEVVESLAVADDDQLLVVSVGGQMVRLRVSEISSMGRDTQGVIIVRLKEGDAVAAVSRIPASELPEEPGGEEGESAGDGPEEAGGPEPAGGTE